MYRFVGRGRWGRKGGLEAQYKTKPQRDNCDEPGQMRNLTASDTHYLLRCASLASLMKPAPGLPAVSVGRLAASLNATDALRPTAEAAAATTLKATAREHGVTFSVSFHFIVIPSWSFSRKARSSNKFICRPLSPCLEIL